MSRKFKTLKEFWLFYVKEHRRPETRICHFVGMLMFLCLTLIAFYTGEPRWLVFGIFAAYALAWTGHLYFEHNTPTTFKYPLLSLLGDFKMFLMMLVGETGPDVPVKK